MMIEAAHDAKDVIAACTGFVLTLVWRDTEMPKGEGRVERGIRSSGYRVNLSEFGRNLVFHV
jgi:hypothetical protein